MDQRPLDVPVPPTTAEPGQLMVIRLARGQGPVRRQSAAGIHIVIVSCLTNQIDRDDSLMVVVLPKRNRLAERREATRLEILDAAWETARRDSLAGLTLREVAERVGMQPPSLYSHFASKNAIYDAMFEQAWRTLIEEIPGWIENLPTEPRARLIAGAELYFDFAVADLARHQLMDVKIIPNFEPCSQ